MKKLLTPLFIAALLLSACNLSSKSSGVEPSLNPVEDMSTTSWSISKTTDRAITFHKTISNPTSGALLSTYLVIPNTEPSENFNQPFKTVFLVPGGLDYGSKAYTGETQTELFLINHEIAYAYFDPDGRGESTGEEDTNGFVQQDGLFAASLAVLQHKAVDSDAYGIASFSFGTALASGMLARYADQQPFQWYIDWEGPSAREYVTVGCDAPKDHYMDPHLTTSCEDNDFWSERESVTFLSQITIPYLRVQGIKDHVQSSNEHAIDAINAAASGSSPWTRINDEDPNQTFTYDDPPHYLAKSLTNEYILEMFDLF